MMNQRTQEHLDKAEDIMSELETFYDQTHDNLTTPVGFMAQNQKVQFKAVFEALEEALINLYTTNPDVWDEIGTNIQTVNNLQKTCMNLTGEYERLYQFYNNQLTPIAQQIIEFCENEHTELPRASKTLPTDSTDAEKAKGD